MSNYFSKLTPWETVQMHIEGWLYTIRCMAIGIIVGWGVVFDSCSEWCCYIVGHGTSPRYFWRTLNWDEMDGNGWLHVLKYW